MQFSFPDVSTLELVSFTWKSADTLQVCFTHEDGKLFTEADMTYTGKQAGMEFSVGATEKPVELESESKACVDFAVDKDTFDVSSEQTYAIAAWNEEEDVGTGYVTFVMKGKMADAKMADACYFSLQEILISFLFLSTYARNWKKMI